MVLAAEYSARLKLCGPEIASTVAAHFTEAGLPTRLTDVPGGGLTVDGLMAAIAQDKKVARGKLTLILMRGIGQAFIATDMSADDLSAFLAAKLA